jgi:hypothetical protein
MILKFKNLLLKIQLKFFKELFYLKWNLKKPVLKNKQSLSILKNKLFHFQYALEMPGITQDFKFPRYENMVVTKDILKQIRLKSSNRSTVSICESAPLDGYIIWRLSQLRKNRKSQIKLSVIEIQKGNCEKIGLIGEIYDYPVNIHNCSIEFFEADSFDYLTMLGVTYQLSSPLKVLDHIFTKLLKPGAVFYFDLIHPEDGFHKYGLHKIGETDIEGFPGVGFELADERTEEENAYYLNHPTSAVYTILYTKAAILQFFVTHHNIKFEEMFVSNSTCYNMTTYRAKKAK